MAKKKTVGLKEMKLVPGKSMDEIDVESFGAGPSPLASRAKNVELTAGAGDHPAGAPAVDLNGTWEMAEGGTQAARLKADWDDAVDATVPGSVHASLVDAGVLPDQPFGKNQLLHAEKSYVDWWMKKTFRWDLPKKGAQLAFGAVSNICTVWLNGTKLGDHEGMFGGPTYDVSKLLKEENTLIVKLKAIGKAKGFMHASVNDNNWWRETVVFNNVYGWHYSHCPSLGIWRPVEVQSAPAVRVENPFVATKDLDGTVDVVVDLVGTKTKWSGTLVGSVRGETFKLSPKHFKVKVNATQRKQQLHLRMKIPNPKLWWPNGMGEQNLYAMCLSFHPADGGEPSTVETTFGIRTVEMAPLPEGPRPDRFNWTFVINGLEKFVKGTGWCTMDPLMDFSRERYDRFLTLAADQHCMMIRAWGSGMPETDDFYDLCDRKGLMILQEWPTAWNSHEVQPFDVMEETVRLTTLRVRSHPSLVMRGGGNESDHPYGKMIDMMGRLSIEFDGTRPFHRGEPWGGSNHAYPCYWERRPLQVALTMNSPFWGEFGAACMPVYESVQRYLPDDEKDLWPAPADGTFEYHTPIFGRAEDLSRLTQYAQNFVPDDCSMEEFTVGSQLAQVVALRHPLELSRTRWPHSTGALYYKMNDNYPAASWATADWYGAAKIGHYFCQDVFAPVHACAILDYLNSVGAELTSKIFLLDDFDGLKGKKWRVRVRAFDGTLTLMKEEKFDGKGSIDAPLYLGDFKLDYLQARAVPLLTVVEVLCDGKLADRTFYWQNYEYEQGCLFNLPNTKLSATVKGDTLTVKNEGKLPAVAVYVERPGHLDSFRASDNYFWLDAGEKHAVTVNDAKGLTVQAWNARKARV